MRGLAPSRTVVVRLYFIVPYSTSGAPCIGQPPFLPNKGIVTTNKIVSPTKIPEYEVLRFAYMLGST